MNAAREKVRVAHALKKLPKISAAFECGELSYSKARAMTRIADESNEDYLLMIARHGRAYHVEKLVSSYRRCKRLQESQMADEQHRRRELKYYCDDDGCLVIRGRFPPEQGALIFKALELPNDAPVGARPSGRSSAETPQDGDTDDAMTPMKPGNRLPPVAPMRRRRMRQPRPLMKYPVPNGPVPGIAHGNDL